MALKPVSGDGERSVLRNWNERMGEAEREELESHLDFPFGARVNVLGIF